MTFDLNAWGSEVLILIVSEVVIGAVKLEGQLDSLMSLNPYCIGSSNRSLLRSAVLRRRPVLILIVSEVVIGASSIRLTQS